MLSSLPISPLAPALRPGTSFLFFYTHLEISSSRHTPNLSLQPGPLPELQPNAYSATLPGRGPLISCDTRMPHGLLLLRHPSLTCPQSGSPLPHLRPEPSGFSPSTWSSWPSPLSLLTWAFVNHCVSLFALKTANMILLKLNSDHVILLPWILNSVPSQSKIQSPCGVPEDQDSLLSSAHLCDLASYHSPPPASAAFLFFLKDPDAGPVHLFFFRSSWKILVPDNCTACLLPSFRALLKHHLLREVYPGRSIYGHNPFPASTTSLLSPAWPSPFSVQFSSSVMSNSFQHHGMQHTGFPVHHQLPELLQTHVHQAGDAIQPSHPLSSPSPPTFNLSQHHGFSKESVLHIRRPKYSHFSISPSNEYSGLISFRIDWFDLPAVQGTLRSSPTPQFKSINLLFSPFTKPCALFPCLVYYLFPHLGCPFLKGRDIYLFSSWLFPQNLE